MKRILIASVMGLMVAGGAFGQENKLRPVKPNYSNDVGKGSNFIIKIKGNKCIGTAKYQRNDRDYHFNSITEWDAVKDDDKTRCINCTFKNYDSRTNEHIFTGKTTNIIIFIKNKPYYESY